MMIEKFLSILFPPKCVLCGTYLNADKGNGALCDKCTERYERRKAQLCDVCHRPECECACKTVSSDDRTHLIAFSSDDTRRMIYILKRKNNKNYRAFLAKELSVSIEKMLMRNGGKENCCITYVPRNPESIRDFGFDQAKELALEAAKLLSLPLVCLFSHEKHTSVQKTLNAEERVENANLSYSGKTGIECPEKVIIIDDVITTGSTVNRCISLARGLGAKRVFTATVAVVRK